MSLRSLAAILGVGCVLGCPTLAGAQAVAIDHQPVQCVVANRFPTIEARIGPAGTVARARAYFRAEGSAAWYYAAMEPFPAGFRAVLPKPKKSLKRLAYYLEATDRDLSAARTAEYAAEVVGDARVCSGKLVASSAVGSTAVAISAAGSGPSIPIGFSGSGVAGAGGGLGTTAAVVGGVGAAAAAAAVVAVNRAEDGGGCGGDTLTVVERSATTLTLQWSFRQPPPENCYTVDFLIGVSACEAPPHGNILEVSGTSVTLTGLQPATAYFVHVHPLAGCPSGRVSGGSTNPIHVSTLAAGAGAQPATRADYDGCCS